MFLCHISSSNYLWGNSSGVGISSDYISMKRPRPTIGISEDILQLRINFKLLLSHLFWGQLCFIKQIIYRSAVCLLGSLPSNVFEHWPEIGAWPCAWMTMCSWNVYSPFPGYSLSFLRLQSSESTHRYRMSLPSIISSPWWLFLLLLL